ncbi:GNAT family N-acetyltransferase [Azorhizobium doebereinerae]|uniref:GNAT family N-acetyltransferase n=1 Tax=Azorhizobium doebereinerae TaxID=281091 RepID=UPI00041A06D5|nr:GNAT family N-acetyltransferase [Azorhizobium doebereinerae]
MADDIIRTLTPAEVDLAMDWAAREGWNPGLADAPAFLAQDGQGFLGLIRDGALAATISVVLYGPGYGFLGFYICRPDLRGQGLGLKLWQAGMARLGARTVGLDGVVAQQENYKKSGFVLAHRNIRYGGVPRPVAAEGPVRAVTADLLPAVIAYDAGIVPAPRPDFLARWLVPPGGLALAAGEGEAVTGYGVIRRAREGWRIGPLFADTPAAGRALFAGLIAHAGGEAGPVYMDVPEPHAAARALAEEAGLASCFDTARMYKGADPKLPLDRIYGITSLELG